MISSMYDCISKIHTSEILINNNEISITGEILNLEQVQKYVSGKMYTL